MIGSSKREFLLKILKKLHLKHIDSITFWNTLFEENEHNKVVCGTNCRGCPYNKKGRCIFDI